LGPIPEVAAQKIGEILLRRGARDGTTWATKPPSTPSRIREEKNGK
jgi:hypothetical protein